VGLKKRRRRENGDKELLLRKIISAINLESFENLKIFKQVDQDRLSTRQPREWFYKSKMMKNIERIENRPFEMKNPESLKISRTFELSQ